MESRVVGVLGGGQLGRMMAEAGHRLGVRLAALDPGGRASPAGQVASLCIEGSFKDEERIRELAAVSDVLTVEIEHVNVDILEALVREGHDVQPPPGAIRIIQDKLEQKRHFRAHGVPVPDFADAPTEAAAAEAGAAFGYPFMLKSRRDAYDGRGNARVDSPENIPEAFAALGGKGLYVERWCPFTAELAAMVVRTAEGTLCYPIVETVQQNSICSTVLAPASASPAALAAAEDVCSRAVATFGGRGIYGVEVFLLPDDTVLLNEVAPRPHNSGHYTQDACDVDQFDAHLRAVLGLPLPPPTLKVGAALMVNVLGKGSMEETLSVTRAALPVSGAAVHWYGKAQSRPGRKMAHINVTADNVEQLALRARLLGAGAAPPEGLPVGLRGLVAGSAPAPSGVGGRPVVGVIMGSDSDLPTMAPAVRVLRDFGVPHEVTVVSAHRTPSRMYSYAREAAERGLRVIIAGAGGAAHLPGMVAALTPLPVIGVPVKSSTLSGNDSLLSIVQMPRGVPVATVAIGNGMNAGLLAVRMLGVASDERLESMQAFMDRQEAEVLDKAARLEEVGAEAYLESMGK